MMMIAMMLADLACVFCVAYAREFLGDWLAIPPRAFERGLIAGYAVSGLGYAFLTAGSHFALCCTPIVGLIALGMVRGSRCSNRDRMSKLVSMTEAVGRVLVGCGSVMLTVLFIAGHRGHYLLAGCPNCFYALWKIAASIPHPEEPRRGRRLRNALATLKDAIGPAWMPMPIPTPEGGPA
jgi:hypothetical protein